MRRSLCFVAVLLLAGLAGAGDEPEHRPMTSALALAAGFSPGQAKIIADGSWSMDLNKGVVARRGNKNDFQEACCSANAPSSRPMDVSSDDTRSSAFCLPLLE